MYLLTACLIVLALTTLVASRRARRSRTRPPSGPVRSDLARFLLGNLCTGPAHILACSRVEPSVTPDLLMLVVAFNAGWFIGLMGEWSWH